MAKSISYIYSTWALSNEYDFYEVGNTGTAKPFSKCCLFLPLFCKTLGNLLTRRPFPLNCIIEKYLKTPFRVLHNNCWKFSLCCTLADLIFCIVGQMPFGFDHFKLFRSYVEKVLQHCLCDQKSVANWFSKNLQVVYIVIL